jgi:predicted amidohydrolase
VYAESARFLPGNKKVTAAIPSALLGLTICYDVRFPQLYRDLAQAGVSILMVPAAFTAVTGEAHWHVLLRARAIENGCFVIAPAQTGTHPGGRKTYGHSLVIDPWGQVLVDGGTQPGIVMAQLDLDMVAQVRSRIPSLTHDRTYS